MEEVFVQPRGAFRCFGREQLGIQRARSRDILLHPRHLGGEDEPEEMRGACPQYRIGLRAREQGITAHLSDAAEVHYKCTGFYTPASEGTVAWNDPEIGVAWPVPNPVLSGRDLEGMTLEEYRSKPAFS